MNIPEEYLKDLLWTDEDLGRATILLQGRPRSGKTALAYYLSEAVVGPDNTFIMDWPEEEGTRTLKDLRVPYARFSSQAALELWYPRLIKMKPKAIIWDGLAASYWVFMRERVPSGIPPEDHGKTWNAVAISLRREIIRFKQVVDEKDGIFIVTSHVWGDQDDLGTSQEKRLQVTIPGQLKSNIYGLFSYNLLIEIEDQPDGNSVRVLKTKPTARFIAGVRAPLGNVIPARIPYDLVQPRAAAVIASKLELGIWTPPAKEEENGSGQPTEALPDPGERHAEIGPVGPDERGAEGGVTKAKPKLAARLVSRT